MALRLSCTVPRPLCSAQALSTRCAAQPRSVHACVAARAPTAPQQLQLRVVDCSGNAALLSACAALRVECFYAYPGADNGASALFGEAADTAQKAWEEARQRAEEARAPRMDALGMQVTCVAALCHSADDNEEHADGEGSQVVGTLDVHVGDRLPGEPLQGTMPADVPTETPSVNVPLPWWEAPMPMLSAGSLGARASYAASLGRPGRAPPVVAGPPVAQFVMPPEDAPEPLDAAAMAALAAGAALRRSCSQSNGERAYLFNVCVSPSARRRGVAAQLLCYAHEAAREAGVRTLYVHVEAENDVARRLYAAAGYSLEAGEPHWLATRLGRPRRLLLRKSLTSAFALQ